jgi:hypothetical protein
MITGINKSGNGKVFLGVWGSGLVALAFLTSQWMQMCGLLHVVVTSTLRKQPVSPHFPDSLLGRLVASYGEEF